MSLPSLDTEYLTGASIIHTVTIDGGMICVVLPSFAIPMGYSVSEADLLLRLNPSYPDVPPDMWWFDPSVTLADGTQVVATNNIESYLGRRWQRWSRHFKAGQWRAGVDSLESYLALINSDLHHHAQAVA